MADQSTFERVVTVLREQGGLDGAKLTRETKLAEAGLDSLATVEAVMACEDEFGVELDADASPETVGAFVDMIDELLEN